MIIIITTNIVVTIIIFILLLLLLSLLLRYFFGTCNLFGQKGVLLVGFDPWMLRVEGIS